MNLKPKKNESEFGYIIYGDGGARGNPGPAAYGFVIYGLSKNKIYEEGKTIGIATNNTAEYYAVIAALRYLASNSNNKVLSVNFLLDSKLVVEQLSGRWKIKNENLRSLHYTVRAIEKSIGAEISYQHIPRETNSEADMLVNLALDGKI